MKKALLYTMLVALSIICLGQGYYIYAQKKSSDTVTADNLPSLSEKLHQNVKEHISRGEALSYTMFDDFFDDEFFRQTFNPFSEMERIHKQMAAMFQESERNMLDNSWDNWFNERLGMDDFKTKVSRTDKNVVLTVDVPGIDGNTASVDINDNRIKISFTARNIQEKNDKTGTMHQEYSQSYMKILPMPEDAVATGVKTLIEENKVTITFNKKDKKAK